MLLLELFAAPSSLYVNRPLIETDEFTAWVKEHFKKALSPGEYHVTIAHAKNHFDWSKLHPETTQLTVWAGPRSVQALGDKGAIVLMFESDALQERWQAIREAGAQWDYPKYQPHVTITYSGGKRKLEDIPPFQGVLKFGAEQFAPVTEYKPHETKYG